MRVCAQTRLLLLLQPKSISTVQRGVCQALRQHSQALSIPKQPSLYSQGRLDTAHGVCRSERKQAVRAESWQINLSGQEQPQRTPGGAESSCSSRGTGTPGGSSISGCPVASAVPARFGGSPSSDRATTDRPLPRNSLLRTGAGTGFSPEAQGEGHGHRFGRADSHLHVL